MSLGSDKLGKSKAVVGKGLADGVEFKSNPYEILDEFFHDPKEESVVYIRNKYFRYSLVKFLEEMNFTFLHSDIENHDRAVISLIDGTFKFIDHMEDSITYELPYDWDSLEADIRNYVSENPIVKKQPVQRNPENWDKPNGEDDNADLIDKSMESVKSHIKTLQEKFGIGMDEVKKMVKDYQKKTHHSVNETSYPAKGNPDVKLKSGIYNNIVDLVKKHSWEAQFESDYGVNIMSYIRENSEQGTEERLISEFGFEYVLENITVDESEFWNNRIIEVKYKDQEELPDIDMSEFEEIDQKSKSLEDNSIKLFTQQESDFIISQLNNMKVGQELIDGVMSGNLDNSDLDKLSKIMYSRDLWGEGWFNSDEDAGHYENIRIKIESNIPDSLIEDQYVISWEGSDIHTGNKEETIDFIKKIGNDIMNDYRHDIDRYDAFKEYDIDSDKETRMLYRSDEFSEVINEVINKFYE